jgi:DNA-binding transcriptional LysR family regulator
VADRVGLGIAFAPEDIVEADINAGQLIRVLGDWCAPFPGYHLYYRHRRQPAPAFAVFVEALRYRPPDVPARRARSR